MDGSVSSTETIDEKGVTCEREKTTGEKMGNSQPQGVLNGDSEE